MYTYFIIAIFILILVMQNKTRGMKQSIQKLIRQSARYATTAQQDKSPAISILHANYAVAYLHALKDIVSDSQIHNREIPRFYRTSRSLFGRVEWGNLIPKLILFFVKK